MITIQTDDVDIGALINAAKQRGTGAVVVFDGIVRDDDIVEMELEAYEDVAQKELEKIAEDATTQFNLLSVDIVHRYRAPCGWGKYPDHRCFRRPQGRSVRGFPVHH